MKQVIPRITVILIISISMVLLFFIGWTFIDSGGGSSVSAKEFQPLLKDEGIRVTLPPMKPGYLSELYAQKKYRAIISSHNKSGARQRKSLKNRYIVGMSYYRLKQYSKAIKSFQPIANDKNPVAEWVYYYLSASYHFMGEHQKALGFLKKIRTEYPDSPFLDRALEIEGKTFLLLKKNQELIDSYNPLIKKSGDRVKSRLHYFLGLANESLKKKTRAAAHYRKVLEMSGNTYKGLCLKRLRVLIPRLEKSLSKSELLGTARYHLRRTKSRRQKKQGALLALKTLGYISGKSSDSTEYNKMLLMATSQERLNRITQAQKTYQAMLSRFSASSRYQMLGQYHYARFMFKRNPRKSYDMLKKIIHTPGHPSHAEACDLIERYKLSWSVDFDKRLVPIAFSQEKYRLVDRIMMRWIASKKYREFISFFSTVTDSNRFPAYTVKVKYWLGMSALQLGKRDIAIKHFKDAFLTYNRTYYSYRALDRLRALLKGDPDAIYRVLEENQRNKNRLISSKQYQLKYQSLIRQFDFAGLDDKNFRKAYYLMSFGEIFHGYKAFLTYLSSLGGDRPRHFAVIARMF
ncbi:MAG: tetratricopeptide repeat protein, partial [Spirochaetota bacterium]|nr:tetratricopeptide repeat protein [Spirochaetota bacterium]